MPTFFLFDLYGTILRFDQRTFMRNLLKELDLPAGQIRTELFRILLVRNYSSVTDMLTDWCRATGIRAPDSDQLRVCSDVLHRHIAGIQPYEGARTLLAFLHCRGFKLGLLSNAAQVFKAPFFDLKLDKYFDAIAFSCDTGTVKPNPNAYLTLCGILAATPEQCVFVGDSPNNDCHVPLTLGMRALRVSRSAPPGPAGQISDISQLLWYSVPDGSPPAPLIGPAESFAVGGEQNTIERLTALPDNEQGRYNIVGRAWCRNSRGAEREFYCKRFLAPESAHVEYAAYQVLDLILPAGRQTALLAAAEPVLLLSSVPGRPWCVEDLDETTAELIGGHCAVAYLIANADLRPRNTFVDRQSGVSVSVIDLEHCFFDRALDVSGLADPFDPETIDRFGAMLVGRTERRALSRATIRRTRRTFLPVEDRSDDRVKCFRNGWIRAYETAKRRSSEIEAFLLDRIYRRPYLVIGTRSHRRAMAALDVRDIMQRISQDSAAAFEACY